MAHRSADAVSPVVGVMLMLVVTIIIAAIVSAFAGGLSSNTEKTPNVQLNAHYSQSQGMWFENAGPDTLSTVSTNVYVRLSDSFGTAEHQVWAVNRTTISNTTNPTYSDSNVWLTNYGMTGGVKVFGPGDRMYINPPYQTYTYLQSVGLPTPSATYQLSNAANLGKTFWLELTDKNGHMIARKLVKIEA